MIEAARIWTFRALLVSMSLIIAHSAVADDAAFAGTLDKIRQFLDVSRPVAGNERTH